MQAAAAVVFQYLSIVACLCRTSQRHSQQVSLAANPAIQDPLGCTRREGIVMSSDAMMLAQDVSPLEAAKK